MTVISVLIYVSIWVFVCVACCISWYRIGFQEGRVSIMREKMAENARILEEVWGEDRK